MSVWTDPYEDAEAGRLRPAITRARGRHAALVHGIDEERMPVRGSETLASRGTWDTGDGEADAESSHD